MKIINIVDRPLTEGESKTIEVFARLTGTACFACLQDQVCVILPPLTEDHVSELTDIVRERLDSIDDTVSYSRFYMPEDHVMVGLPGGVCAMSDGECEGEPSSVLTLRHLCIDACREKQIAAIVFNYE